MIKYNHTNFMEIFPEIRQARAIAVSNNKPDSRNQAVMMT